MEDEIMNPGEESKARCKTNIKRIIVDNRPKVFTHKCTDTG